MILVIVTTILATRHLTKQINRANKQRDDMYLAFMRSAKLGSLGEIASGLAHEINNPLAIISSEQTNISDIVQDSAKNEQDQLEILESVEKVAGLVEGISMSSQNQAQSVSQIEAAIGQMENVVQANSSNAEQTSSSSQELSSQAATMKAIVEELVGFVNGDLARIRLLAEAPEGARPVLADPFPADKGFSPEF